MTNFQMMLTIRNCLKFHCQ